MSNLKLSSPWQELANEFTAMFGADPDINVVFEEGENKIVKLYVDNDKKAAALEILLPSSKDFGNVTVYIEVIPANINHYDGLAEIYEQALSGNPAFSRVVTGSKGLFAMSYVMFKPEVVQFFNDELSDANGFKHTLYQDIARDIFDPAVGLSFCTELKDGVNKPLGEWP